MKHLLLFCIILCLFNESTRAQSSISAPIPPELLTVDRNDIDVVSNIPVVNLPSISVGDPKNGGLEFHFTTQGSAFTNSLTSYIPYGTGPLFGTAVFGNSSSRFNGVSSGSPPMTVQDSSHRGATLQYIPGGSNGTFGTLIYTMRDGTVVNMDQVATSRNGTKCVGAAVGFVNTSIQTGAWGTPGNAVMALATSARLPDGTIINYHYKTVNVSKESFCGIYKRLQSVTNTNGFMIKFSYLANTATSFADISGWITTTSIVALNNAIDYCNPDADICQPFSKNWQAIIIDPPISGRNASVRLKDSLQNSTTLTYDYDNSMINTGGSASSELTSIIDSNGVTRYKFLYGGYYPGLEHRILTSSYKHGVSYAYDFNPRASLPADGQQALPTNAMIVKQQSTDGYNNNITTFSDKTSGNLLHQTNELGSSTIYTEDNYGRLIKIVHPEKDYEVYTYDDRGNVVQKSMYSKPQSGVSTIVSLAGYDSNCANFIKCNQPNWVIDAMGKETDFTYDADSGWLTSITEPATLSGVRPQTRYTYSQLQAYYLQSPGVMAASGSPRLLLTGMSKCQTQSGAALAGTTGQGPFSLSGPAACANTSDEMITTNDYGLNSAPNNLWLRGIAVTANGQTHRTCYGYDINGRRVSETSPQAALANCP